MGSNIYPRIVDIGRCYYTIYDYSSKRQTCMKLLSESVFREFGKVLLNLLQVIIVATLITNPLSGKDVITNDLLWVYLAAALFCFMFGWLFIRVADRMKEHKEKQEKRKKKVIPLL